MFRGYRYLQTCPGCGDTVDYYKLISSARPTAILRDKSVIDLIDSKVILVVDRCVVTQSLTCLRRGAVICILIIEMISVIKYNIQVFLYYFKN